LALLFLPQENMAFTINWLSLIGKKGKKSSFYKEKCLVGLTPFLFWILCIWGASKYEIKVKGEGGEDL
jgi:hypothetical protein